MDAEKSKPVQVVHVVGARPNLMKVAPVYRAIANLGVNQRLIHTGQHYDEKLSGVFFKQLGLPAPDYNLGVGSGSHAEQTGRVLIGIEPLLDQLRPEWVVVYGDVNSTVAATLAATKLQLRVAHVEAGLRSFDRTMPEELNRIVTDQLCDLLLTPSQDGNENLIREGIPPERIHFVGNVMIDSLVHMLPQLTENPPEGLESGGYGLVTLHRPSNVDDPARLADLMQALGGISNQIPILFPMHPRTRKRIREGSGAFGASMERIRIQEPVGYREFLNLICHARFVITDSGGVQEETTYLRIPCFTLRENTERPVTVTVGTNSLVSLEDGSLNEGITKALNGRQKQGQIPDLWDGFAAQRIASVLADCSLSLPAMT